MPKKGKKGKGKGKKGKKGGKKSSKKGGDSKVAIAAANSKVWEAKLEVAERAKQEYRENSKKIIQENEALQSQMLQTERDTIDVITYLKKQDHEKDGQLEKIQIQMRDQKKDQRKEKERIIEDFSKQINELEEKLGEKTRDVDLMQSELKLVKEFRRKRGQMQKDLDEIKESMYGANREHKATLARMEQKFFEEKMRLQQEANQKIAELAERAHTEAISNLDETTRSVYKENVRLSEALRYHMKEGEMLKHAKDTLETENANLKADKELNDIMIQEKVVQVKQQKDQIKSLQEKVQTLEKSLSHMSREFTTEKRAISEKSRIENEAGKIELAKLQRVIELKSREMTKVKKLAKNILDQRTELERFFLEALEQVKREISSNQSQYRKDAQVAYQQKMLAAFAGKGEYPRVRTFNKADNSTNSVFRDLEAAQKLYEGDMKVDVSDLTWEQKERVLRFLFAKMNGSNVSRPQKTASAPTLPSLDKHQHRLSITQGEQGTPTKVEDETDKTFLTQAQVEVPESVLPDLRPTQAWSESEPVHAST
ncbi:hypothetical protein ScPMuIL_013934 [Solemya velum]